MMDLQAAIGIHQLAARRAQLAPPRGRSGGATIDAFADLPIELPAEPEPEPDTRHAYHLYTILVDEARAGISRDEFLGAMTRYNIGVGRALPEHPRASVLPGELWLAGRGLPQCDAVRPADREPAAVGQAIG